MILTAAMPAAFAQEPAPLAPQIGELVHFDTSPPLRDLPATMPAAGPADRQIPISVPLDLLGRYRGSESFVDPLTMAGPLFTAGPAPSPSANFEGLSDDDNAATIGSRVVPPDTEGDVGPDHYVQMINLIFAVYDKDGSICGAPGCIVPGGGPRAGNDIWQGFGGICETNNDGDPILLYDHLAGRWMFSQFAFFDNQFRGHQCIAVSQTSDPTGPYHRYDFVVSPSFLDFADYPKLGLWADGYYMTANEFNFLSGFNGAFAYAFERDRMLAGQSAQMVKFGPLPCNDPGECFFSLQPSHLEGPAPPAGTPNTFVMAFDDETWGVGGGPDGYKLWDFSVDWNNTGNSTFTSLGQVNTDEFDANLCGFAACVPQLGSAELLDTLSQFTMFRAQFRDWGTEQTLVVSHTVDVGGNLAGVRWAELVHSGGSWSRGRTGTIGAGGDPHRWMGSAAMDGARNIAVGYSASSSSIYPDIRYTVIDPAGTPTDEGVLFFGTGSQSASSNRWGDYSTMSVDPADDCTFWYTQEYYADPGASFDFKTRIGAFKAAGCGGGGEPVCGNGVVEEGEQCDDGNTDGGDCCAADCTFEASGSSCEGTLFCVNGETCDGAGTCGGGTPITCGDGVICTDDSCDEGADTCVNTPNDANCDNGLFCDGAESCDPVDDCQPGTPVDCNDGVDCTVDSCNEGTDQCDNVPDDALCPNDGQFCTGTEFCDPVNDCSSTGNPCAAGQTCNETTDTCEDVTCLPKRASCTTDAECCSNKCRGKARNKSCK